MNTSTETIHPFTHLKRFSAFLSLALFLTATLSALVGKTADMTLTRFDLGGQWQVSASGSNDWFDASVPGCIHTDLLAAKRIPDPFYRDNEKRVQWVSE